MKQSTPWPFGAALLVSLWLAGCGGSSSTPPAPRGDGTLVAANAGDLASYMQAKARERQALRASPGGLPVLTSVGDGAAAPTGAAWQRRRFRSRERPCRSKASMKTT